jgi:hypothetical protein
MTPNSLKKHRIKNPTVFTTTPRIAAIPRLYIAMMGETWSVLYLFTDKLRSRCNINVIALPESNNFSTHSVNLCLCIWVVSVKIGRPCPNSDHPASTIVTRSSHTESSVVVWHHRYGRIDVNYHVVAARIGTPRYEPRSVLCGAVATRSLCCMDYDATT